MMELLLSFGASLELKDSDGITVLGRCIRTNEPVVFDFLIEKGANSKAVDIMGHTILHR